MIEHAASELDPPLRPAIAVIAEAEQGLRDAAAKAATNGHYDALAVITRWAKTLQSLVSESTQEASFTATTSSATKSPSPKESKSARPAARVPVFTRDADMLVKTARSRKSKNEYQHRAPTDVVLTTAECLSEWRPNRKLMTGQQLLDSYAKKKGAVVSYQVYVALGWFTQIGLIRRHGRSGYSVPQAITIVGDVQKAWEALRNGERQ